MDPVRRAASPYHAGTTRFADVNTEVVLHSYPKCGRTWLRYLFLYLYGEHLAATHGVGPDAQPRKRVILIRDVRDVLVSYYFEVINRSGFGGTGSPRLRRARGRWQRRRRLLRVPGAAAACRALDRRRFADSRDPALAGELDAFVRTGVIDDFFDYYRACGAMPGDSCTIRYEDLQADTCAELARLARFLGKPVDDGAIADAVARASFDNMRELEVTGRGVPGVFHQGTWLPNLTSRDTTVADALKTRRGRIGGYVDYLAARSVAYIDRIVSRRHADVARRYGYAGN